MSLIKEYKIWILTHFPAAIMAGLLVYDPSYWKILTPYSGYTAVVFFVLVLSLTPLKAIFPQWMVITKLNRCRRELGVASFAYAAIHIVCFIIKRGGIEASLPYVFHPALIPVVWIGFPLLFVLALTSNNYSVKRLTFKRWKQLHKMVYWAEVAIIIHMILVGDKLWAAILFGPLCFIQLKKYRNDKKKHKAMNDMPPF